VKNAIGPIGIGIDVHDLLSPFILPQQGGDSSSLMGAFDAVRREHAAMPAEAYNDDHVYKQKLNQVRTCIFSRECARSSRAILCDSAMLSVARICRADEAWRHFSGE
jgi:hypothetical protein